MDDSTKDDGRSEQERENAARKTALEQHQGGDGGGEDRKMQFTNEPDPRSKEERAKAIDEHEKKADDLRRESTDRAMEVPEHVREYRGPFHGGQDIIDTRGRPAIFSGPNIQVMEESPTERAKRMLAEESPPVGPSRAERAAFEKNPSDATARAEVIARG